MLSEEKILLLVQLITTLKENIFSFERILQLQAEDSDIRSHQKNLIKINDEIKKILIDRKKNHD